MKRTSLIAAILAAALMYAGGAYAADMPLKAPPVALPAPTWTGWYVGINGGGIWGTAHPSAVDVGPDGFFAVANVPGVLAGASQGINMSGGLVGGQIGYLYQADPAIFGIEAGFDWSSLRGSASNGPTPYLVTPASTFAWNLQGKQDWLFTFLGRAGLNEGNWFPYLTGGLAIAHQTYSANFIDTFYPSNVTNSFSNVEPGLALGGGVEVRLADHWLLRGEYSVHAIRRRGRRRTHRL
jgi:outer membrane immunogenic protein